MSAAIRLDGRTAVVTGAGQGLGQAYAIALAAAGAAVVVNDVQEDSAARTVAQIVEAGGKAVACVGAVGPTATADALVEAAVGTYGGLDILVANAGVLRDRTLWNMSDDDFDLVVDTHLRGSFTCGRAAARYMREHEVHGRIILIGSPAGQFGSFGQTNYAAVKAGLVAMARTWSLELARANITANAVIPTALTPMTATIPAYAEVYQNYLDHGEIPTEYRRDHALGSPEDVAPLVVWLASDAAADVTGQAIGIGGDRLSLYGHPFVKETRDRDGGWSPESIDELWSDDLAGLAEQSGPRKK